MLFSLFSVLSLLLVLVLLLLLVCPSCRLRDACKIEINGEVYGRWMYPHWRTSLRSPSRSSSHGLYGFWEEVLLRREVWRSAYHELDNSIIAEELQVSHSPCSPLDGICAIRVRMTRLCAGYPKKGKMPWMKKRKKRTSLDASAPSPQQSLDIHTYKSHHWGTPHCLI